MSEIISVAGVEPTNSHRYMDSEKSRDSHKGTNRQKKTKCNNKIADVDRDYYTGKF